ncbi:Hypothetical dipeptidyl aminopeptidase/ acylaminoacyl-peptidase related protein [Mycobacteroides abscessus subsp. abscessus]|nr:Hypothetical dipeptidyl aminopeptidase/ acylaminoacyl-peptidase related protein [Mycobacteroides abscessus subsp. abscessus]
MRFIFETDESFSFETLRTVGYTAYGGPISARLSLLRSGSRRAIGSRGTSSGARWPTGSRR